MYFESREKKKKKKRQTQHDFSTTQQAVLQTYLLVERYMKLTVLNFIFHSVNQRVQTVEFYFAAEVFALVERFDGGGGGSGVLDSSRECVSFARA